MAQSDPVAPRALFVLRPGNGNRVTGSATGPVTAPLPVADPVTQPSRITGSAEDATGSAAGSELGAVVTPLPVPLTLAERAQLTARHWAAAAANGAGQLWLHPDRLLYVLWHGRPETMAEHRAYIKSRAWVPGELTGKWRTTVVFIGVIYHTVVARPVKAMARTVDAAAERPLRLTLLAAFVAAFAVFAVPHIPLI